ncbi:MAG: hypothetical protein JWM91_3774, partial [Rhodospirillales bacterium]|nr:hypothetical protein [Rhodospirillales bacterium]
MTATSGGVYIADMSTNPRTLIAATLLLSLAVICFVLLSQYVQFYQPCE